MKLKEPVITKSLSNKLTRMILRMMPIFPGPELFDLFVELREGRNRSTSKLKRLTKP